MAGLKDNRPIPIEEVDRLPLGAVIEDSSGDLWTVEKKMRTYEFGVTYHLRRLRDDKLQNANELFLTEIFQEKWGTFRIDPYDVEVVCEFG